MMRAFSKILIANRGEIACRVIEAARKKGYRSVAVFSEADACARHVSLADEAVAIGPAPVSHSYLSVECIIDAAKRSGADAVHPGYGFLSENAHFAQACADAGLVFIGPSPEAIRAMGNKAAAKRRMIEAGVPCVPGYQGEAQDDATFTREADRIGFPIMVKAAAGGGGRGMRLVKEASALADALASARSEAKTAFGSGELILEKAVIEPRHVEIQIMADNHGHVIHLGERDCSVQRRHQKVLEEAPCPVASDALRAAMGAAAVKAAQSIGYSNAGTVEFLLDRDGKFYFLETNTRLQVEHPVTECVTGIDIVALQIDVAAGLPLPITQEQVALRGHAIEARLYAEDPANQFLPQTGSVLVWRPAQSEGVRIDHGVVEGTEVSPFYDPMLAKIIAQGTTRADARRKLIAALENTVLLGVTTNKSFLIDMLRHPVFAEGAATTAFIETNFSSEHLALSGDPLARSLAAALLVDASSTKGELKGWWSTGFALAPVKLSEGEKNHRLEVAQRGMHYTIKSEGQAREIEIIAHGRSEFRFIAEGIEGKGFYAIDGTRIHIDMNDRTHAFEDITYAPAAAKDANSDGLVRAPMSGRVIGINVKAGYTVEKGQTLAVLEAMKMEHQLKAAFAGTVSNVSVQTGEQVTARQVLLTLAKDGT
ncbi:MAG TPA: acetyl-CoA carboxylase biotin carboxylase subunit [Rhizomicrobium sp.]|nr:acetyl-CoA carboxylase biotin carboxylase subunit [Rhizomicrobium sp.]